METNFINIMTPIEKAKEVCLKYQRLLFIDTTGKHPQYIHNDSILCAIICVDEIIDAFISGGRDSFELQNMDKEFRFWYEVKDELNRMKS